MTTPITTRDTVPESSSQRHAEAAQSRPSGTADETSAQAIIQSFLDTYGLGALGDWAWQKVLRGEGIQQIMLEMRETPTYQQRFPAMAELAKQGRGISEADYIGMENAYRSTLHAYGLPAGFYDQPADFAQFMVGDVSPNELNDRVKQYTAAVYGDPETLRQLRGLYDEYGHDGNPAGDLLAHYLDPKAAEPLLAEQLSAAQFAAAAKTSGYGQIGKAQAELFGARRDVSAEQAAQGFSQLVRSKELFTGLPGQAETDIGQLQQLGAAFGGDTLAQQEIEKRARTRVAEGGGGGGFTASSKGVTGLGSSQT